MALYENALPMATQEKNKGGFLGGLGYLGEKLGAGVMSSLEGIWDYAAGGIADLFGADEWAEKQFKNDWFGDWYRDAGKWYNPSDGWKVAGDIASGIGTSLPAIAGTIGAVALTTVSGGAAAPLAAKILAASIAPTIAGLSAAGNATKEAYQKTGTLSGKEYGYGALVGATEGAIEGVTGAIGAGTARVGKAIGKALVREGAEEAVEQAAKQGARSGVRSIIGGTVKHVGKDFVGEAVEEGLAEIMSPQYAKLTYDPDAENATLEEVAYASFVGGMAGVIMGGGGDAFAGAQNTRRNVKIGNETVEAGQTGEILAVAKGMTETMATDRSYAGYEVLTEIEKTYNALAESLKKTGGEITTGKQRAQLGALKQMEAATHILPYVEQSARAMLQNPEAVAARYQSMGLTDGNGQPLTITPEALTAGVTDGDIRTLRRALSENRTLATLAIADATGKLMLDAEAYSAAAESGYAGTRGEYQRFMETASPEVKAALAERLGIENLDATAYEDFAAVAQQYAATPDGSAAVKTAKAARRAAEKAAPNEKAIPRVIGTALADGTYRYGGENGIAVLKEGDTVRIYDYETRSISRPLSIKEANSALQQYRKASERTEASTHDGDMRRYSLPENIDGVDVSEYNEITLSGAEKARLQSEAMTWAPNDRNVLKRRTLGGTSYAYIMDSDGIVHCLGKEPSTNIHEWRKGYDNRGARGSDRLSEKYRSRQGNDRGNSSIGQDGRKSAETSSNDVESVSREGHSDGRGRGEDAASPYRRKKKAVRHKFDEDGSGHGITYYSDGTTERFALPEGSDASATATARSVKSQAATREEVDAWALEHVKGYRELAPNERSEVRATVRQAQELGFSESDVTVYATVAVRSGVRISFSKERTLYTKKDGSTAYSDGFYDPKTNEIVVNPEGKRSAGRLLFHELSHALYGEKKFTKALARAVRDMNADRAQELLDRYREAGRTDLSELTEEVIVHHAEDVLGNRTNLERLVRGEPTLRDKILSFFDVARTEYNGNARLSRAAGRLYRHFEAALDTFAAATRTAEPLTRTNPANTQVSGEGRRDAEGYSYDALIRKNDISIVTFPTELPLTDKGEIDKNAVVTQGRLNARQQKNPNNTEERTYVHIGDIGLDVLLSKKGMIHGIARSQETAFAVMKIGDVLKNSVAVNELNGSAKRKAEMSYVLLGACRDSENLYVVRSVVSKLENDVTEIDVYQLSAFKGKKTETPTSALGGTGVKERNALMSSESPAISIADFLEYVKTIPLANEVFSEDVAQKVGVERIEGSLSGDIRYALPDFESPTLDSVGKEKSKYKPTVGDKIFTAKTRTYIETVDELYGIETYLRKIGGRKKADAEARMQMARASRSQAQTMIGSAQYDVFSDKPERMGDGLLEILKQTRHWSEKKHLELDDYLLHCLNIDRMTLESRSRAWTAAERAKLQTVKNDIAVLENRGKQLRANLRKTETAINNAKVHKGTAKLIATKRRWEAKLDALKRQMTALENAVKRNEQDTKKKLRERDKIEKELKTLELKNKPVFGKDETLDENGMPKRDHDITAAESRAIVKELEKKYPEFPALAKKLYAYLDNLQIMRVEAGLITQEQADYMKKLYPHYVPAYRDVEGGGIALVKGRNNLEISRTVRRAKGGNQNILSIASSIATQTDELMRAGQINLLAREIYEAAKASGDDTYVEILSEETVENPEDATSDAILRPKEGQLTFYHEGKRITMEVSREILLGFDGIRSPSVDFTNPLYRASAALTNLFKRGVTSLNPAFLLRNPIRDLQDAGLNSRHPALLAKHLPLVWKKILKNSKEWELYRALGGFSSTVFDGVLSGQAGYAGFESIAELFAKIDGETDLKAVWSKMSAPAKAVFRSIENANAFLEQTTRFAEFCASLEAGDSPAVALNNSAEVTTNFGRRGRLVKMLNATLMPFLNPAVQGFDKIFRNVGDAFTGGHLVKGLATLLTKAAIIGVLPILLNSLMYDDDEDYERLRENDKENYFLIKTGDGSFIKIPRGRLASVIGGLYNRGSKLATGEDAELDGYLDNVVTQVTPVENVTRTIFSPFFDIANNRTWYGGEIEGREFDDTAPRDRYDESTSSIAVKLGRVFNYSPKKIHYLLDQYSGVVGDFVLPATTEKEHRDFFSGNFTLDSVTNNKLSEKFYKAYDETQYAKTAGDETAAYRIKYLNRVKKSVKELSEELEAIRTSGETNTEKLQRTRVVRALINAEYDAALQSVGAVDAAIGDTAAIEDETLRDAEITRRVFGAESALENYNKKTYEKYQLFNKTGIGYDELYVYHFATLDLESDLDKNGKTVAGSRRRKILSVINALDIPKEQKLLLLAARGYAAKDGDIKGVSAARAKSLLLSYITGQKELTKAEKEALAKACGFKVRNGSIVVK